MGKKERCRKFGERILTMILCVSMILSSMPAGVSAGEADVSAAQDTEAMAVETTVASEGSADGGASAEAAKPETQAQTEAPKLETQAQTETPKPETQAQTETAKAETQAQTEAQASAEDQAKETAVSQDPSTTESQSPDGGTQTVGSNGTLQSERNVDTDVDLSTEAPELSTGHEDVKEKEPETEAPQVTLRFQVLWYDGQDEAGTRPDPDEFLYLWADDQKADADQYQIKLADLTTVQTDPNAYDLATYKIAKLPSEEDGETITYTVEEKLPDKYVGILRTLEDDSTRGIADARLFFDAEKEYAAKQRFENTLEHESETLTEQATEAETEIPTEPESETAAESETEQAAEGEAEALTEPGSETEQTTEPETELPAPAAYSRRTYAEETETESDTTGSAELQIIWQDQTVEAEKRELPVLKLSFTIDGEKYEVNYTYNSDSGTCTLNLDSNQLVMLGLPEDTVLTPSMQVTNENSQNQSVKLQGLPGATVNGTKITWAFELDQEKLDLSNYILTEDGTRCILTQKTTFTAILDIRAGENSNQLDDTLKNELRQSLECVYGTTTLTYDELLKEYPDLSVEFSSQGDGKYDITVTGIPWCDPITKDAMVYYFEVESAEGISAGSLGQTDDLLVPTYNNAASPNFGSVTDKCHENGTLVLTLTGTTDYTATKVWLDEETDPANRPAASWYLWRYSEKEDGSYETASPITAGGVQVRWDLTKETPETISTSKNKGESPDVGGEVYGSGLPKYDSDGYRYVYFAREEIEDGSYEQVFGSVSENKDEDGNVPVEDILPYEEPRKGHDKSIYNGGTLSNRKSGTANIPGNKIWIAAHYQSNLADVTVKLTLERRLKNDGNSNFEATETVVELSEFTPEFMTKEITASGTFPQYDELGQEYEYRWVETGVYEGNSKTNLLKTDEDGNPIFVLSENKEQNDSTKGGCEEHYKVTYDEEGNVVNTLVGTTNYVVEKVWDESLEQPDSINIILKQIDTEGNFVEDGDKQYTVYKKDEWYLDITGLTKYDDNGALYSYIAVEDAVSGANWTATYEYDVEDLNHGINNVRITNVVSGLNKRIRVRKVWLDGDDASSRLPVNLEVWRDSYTFTDSDNKEYKVEARKLTDLTLTAEDEWWKYVDVTEYWHIDEKGTVTIDSTPENGWDLDDCKEHFVGNAKYYVKEVSLGTDKKYERFGDNQLSSRGLPLITTSEEGYQYEIIEEKSKEVNSDDYITVTNRRVGTIDLSVTKNWVDGIESADQENEKKTERAGLRAKIELVFTTEGHGNSLVNDSNGNGQVLLDHNGETWSQPIKKNTGASASISQALTGEKTQTVYFYNLPKYDLAGHVLHYSVEETSSDELEALHNADYTVSIKDTGYTVDSDKFHTHDSQSITVTNKKEKTGDVVFYKKWIDEAVSNRRPDLYLTLYQLDSTTKDGESYIPMKSGYADEKWSADENHTDNWTCVFKNMPLYDVNGQKIIYYATEGILVDRELLDYIPEQYWYAESSEDETSQDGVVLNNSDYNEYSTVMFDEKTEKFYVEHTVGTVDMASLENSSDVLNAADGKTVLRENGTFVNEIRGIVSVSGQKVWENIPEGFPTNELPCINLTLKRKVKGDDKSTEVATIVNESGRTDLKKTGLSFDFCFKYEGKNRLDGHSYPSSDGDGDETEKNDDESVSVYSTAVDSDTETTSSAVRLPKYDKNGSLYEYSVSETIKPVDGSDPDDYYDYIKDDNVNYYTIKNTYTPKTGTVTVGKKWEDVPQNSRYPEITFKLYRFYECIEKENGAYSKPVLVDTKKLNYSETEPSVLFKDLPLYAPNGKAYIYYVVETSVDGYSQENVELSNLTGQTVEYKIDMPSTANPNGNNSPSALFTLVKLPASADTDEEENINGSNESETGTDAQQDTEASSDPAAAISAYTGEEENTGETTSSETEASTETDNQPGTDETEETELTGSATVTFTNKYSEYGTVKLKGTKQWDDYSNAFHTRPQNITLTLYRSAAKQSTEENSNNEISGQPMCSFSVGSTTNSEMELTLNAGITNESGAVKLTLTKTTSETENNVDDVSSLSETDETTDSSDGNEDTWQYVITGLDQYAPNGSPWVYRIVEAADDHDAYNNGNETSVSQSGSTTAEDESVPIAMNELKNTLTTSASVEKSWTVDGVNEEETDGFNYIKPYLEVTVKLQVRVANGSDEGDDDSDNPGNTDVNESEPGDGNDSANDSSDMSESSDDSNDEGDNANGSNDGSVESDSSAVTPSGDWKDAEPWFNKMLGNNSTNTINSSVVLNADNEWRETVSKLPAGYYDNNDKWHEYEYRFVETKITDTDYANVNNDKSVDLAIDTNGNYYFLKNSSELSNYKVFDVNWNRVKGSGKTTITNKLTSTISISISKVWDDSDNITGVREKIRVQVKRKLDGENDTEYQDIDDLVWNWDGEDTITVKNLPRYAPDGTEYVYRVVEVDGDQSETFGYIYGNIFVTSQGYGYEISYNPTSTKQETSASYVLKITNTLETVSVKAVKEWKKMNGAELTDDIPDSSASVYLEIKPNGESFPTPVYVKLDGTPDANKTTAYESDAWTALFTGLPKYKYTYNENTKSWEKSLIQYQVEEVKIIENSDGTVTGTEPVNADGYWKVESAVIKTTDPDTDANNDDGGSTGDGVNNDNAGTGDGIGGDAYADDVPTAGLGEDEDSGTGTDESDVASTAIVTNIKTEFRLDKVDEDGNSITNRDVTLAIYSKEGETKTKVAEWSRTVTNKDTGGTIIEYTEKVTPTTDENGTKIIQTLEETKAVISTPGSTGTELENGESMGETTGGYETQETSAPAESSTKSYAPVVGLPLGTYVLREVNVPDGYEKADNITFTLTTSKNDQEQSVLQITSAPESATIGNESLDLATGGVSYTLGSDGNVTSIDNDLKLTMVDEKIRLRLRKVDSDQYTSDQTDDSDIDQVALGYAEFTITGKFADGTNEKVGVITENITEDTTGNRKLCIEDLDGLWISGEEYTFTETSAPMGYQVASVTIKVDEGGSGKITDNDANSDTDNDGNAPVVGVVDNEAENPTLIFKNEKIRIELEKYDNGNKIIDDARLQNAKFKIKGTFVEVVTTEDGKQQTKTKSDTKTITAKYDSASEKYVLDLSDLDGKWLATTGTIDGTDKFTYKLKEVTAPAGYILTTEKLSFTVDQNGHVIFETKDENGGGDGDSDGTDGTHYSGNGTSKIHVTNDPIVIKIKKTDDQEITLGGATFTLQRADASQTGVWADPSLKDEDVKTYTSDSIEDWIEIPGLLVAEKTYTLTETVPPSGYHLPDPASVTFKVNKDGTITKVANLNDITDDNDETQSESTGQESENGAQEQPSAQNSDDAGNDGETSAIEIGGDAISITVTDEKNCLTLDKLDQDRLTLGMTQAEASVKDRSVTLEILKVDQSAENEQGVTKTVVAVWSRTASSNTDDGTSYVETVTPAKDEEGTQIIPTLETTTGKENDSAKVIGLPSGTYILRETVTPDGYMTAADVTFTVDEHGMVNLVLSTSDEASDGSSDGTPAVVNTDSSTGDVTLALKDDQIKGNLTLEKVSAATATEESESLNGVGFKLYRKADSATAESGAGNNGEIDSDSLVADNSAGAAANHTDTNGSEETAGDDVDTGDSDEDGNDENINGFELVTEQEFFTGKSYTRKVSLDKATRLETVTWEETEETTTGILLLKNLEWGEYRLMETTPADGYRVTNDESLSEVTICSFEITRDHYDVEKTGDEALTNQQNQLTLIKTDFTGNALAGAKFTLTEQLGQDAQATEETQQDADVDSAADRSDDLDETGGTAEDTPQKITVTVSNSGDTKGRVDITGQLKAGTWYALEETVAPSGYERLPEKILVMLDANGALSLQKDGEPYAPGQEDLIVQDGTTLTVRNRLIEVQLDKTDANTGESLNGVTLAIYTQADENGSEGQKIATWTRDENGAETGTPETVEGYSITIETNGNRAVFAGIPAGDYFLREVTAPSGYLKASVDVPFTVHDDGSVTLKDDCTLAEVSDPAAADVVTLTLKDEQIRGHVTLTKVLGSTQNDTVLPGTVFDLYKEGADGKEDKLIATGITVGAGGTWSSESKATLKNEETGEPLSDGLRSGKYYFTETKAHDLAKLPDSSEKLGTFTIPTVTDSSNSAADNNTAQPTEQKVTVGNAPFRAELSLVKYDATSSSPIQDAAFKLFYQADASDDGADAASLPAGSADSGWADVTSLLSNGGRTDADGSLTAVLDKKGVYKVVETANVGYDLTDDNAFAAQVTVTDEDYLAEDASAKERAAKTICVRNGDTHCTKLSGSWNAQGVTNVRIPGSVTLTKADGADQSLLAGVGFTLYYREQETDGWSIVGNGRQYLTGMKYAGTDAQGTDIQASDFTSQSEYDAKGKGTLQISGLPWGFYRMVETAPADGYTDRGADGVLTLEFEVKADDLTHTLVTDGTYVSNYKNELRIRKVSTDGTTETLSGAVFELLDAEGGSTILENIAVDGEASLTGQLAGGKTYILREKTAPEGYELAADVRFTMGLDGKLSLDSGVESDTAVVEEDGITVTVKDEPVVVSDTPTEVSILKVDSGTGAALAGAGLMLRDSAGTVLASWESGREPYTLKGILAKGATYELVEISAPEGYGLAQSVAFTVPSDGQAVNVTMEDSPLPGDSYGKITVMKYTSYQGYPLAVEETYYMALFADAALTQRVSSVKAVQLQKTFSGSVAFDHLADGTYYVAETDEYGNPLTGDAYCSRIVTDGTCVLQAGNQTASSRIENAYRVLPPMAYYLGEGRIEVTKHVSDGEQKLSLEDSTFYVRLFMDEEHNYPVSDVQELHFAGSDSAAAVFEGLVDGTYYLAETDADGVSMVSGDSEFGYEIDMPENVFAVSDTALQYSVAFTNVTEHIEEEETVEEFSGEAETETETPAKSVRTADTTPLWLYVLLLAASGAVSGALLYRKRRHLF